MVSWLKFYFLGFFNDEYGKEAASRSFLNVVLSLVAAVVLFCGGITAGYMASFGKHYRDAQAFRDFLYSALASDGARVNLKMQGGKLSSDISDGENINGFIGGERDGFKLVIDTNPAATAFDDFTLLCKDAGGAELSYEEYLLLPDAQRKNCSVSFEYSGKPLDVTAKQAEYTAYLDSVSDASADGYDGGVATAYGELNHKKSSGEIAEEEYAVEIYTLFARSYYPSYSHVESYGKAPTLRTYYIRMSSEGSDYLILLDDTCICEFTTEGGITVNFCSYYSGVDDAAVLTEEMSAADKRAGIDAFIKDCFAGSGGFVFLVYFISACKLVLPLLAIMLFLALLAFAIAKINHIKTGAKYYESFKILGNYLFYSAAVAFLFAIILSFFFERATVYTAIEVIFLCVFVVRAAVLYAVELVKEKRAKKAADPDASDAAEL